MKLQRTLIAALLGVFVSHATAADQTATWNNTSGNWSDFTRWSTNPLFPNNGNGGFTFDATVAAGTVSLDVPITIEGLGMTGGTISGTQPLTVNGPFNRTNGIFTGSGLVTFSATSTSTVAGTFTALGSGVTMLNAGDMTVTAASNNNGLKLTRLGGSGGIQPQFTNTGTLRLMGTADVLADGNGGGAIINNGTIIKEGAPGEDSYVASNHVFTNNGTVEVNGGRMSFYGVTHTGAYQIAAGAVMFFEGTHAINAGTTITGDGVFWIGRDTTTVNTPLNIGPRLDLVQTTFGGGIVANAPLSLDGGLFFNGFNLTISGPADVTLNRPVDWRQGNMSGTGQTIIPAGVTADLTTGTGKVIFQRTTTNHGTMNVSGGRFDLRDNAVLNNHGTMNLLDEGADMNTNLQGTSNTLNNFGTFTKSGAGTTSDIIGMIFNNSGLVQVLSGTLAIGGNATGNNHDGGSFEIAAGAILRLGAGGVTHASTATTTFTGDGELQLSSGTSQWSGTSIETPTSFIGGTLTTLAGGVSFARDVNWTGGSISGTGGVTFQLGVTASLTGPTIKLVSTNTVENHGTINVSGGRFDIRDNAVMNNHGTMNLLDEAADMQTNLQGTNNTLNNFGTITKSGAGTTSTIALNIINNAGTMRVDEGTLGFGSGTFTQSAGAMVLNGGNVSSSATLNIHGGSTQGAGTITGNVAVTGGTVAPGIGGATGTLAITGNLTTTAASTVEVDIAGTTPGTQYDVVSEAGATAFARNGVLAVRVAPAFLPTITPAHSFTVITSNQATTGQFSNVLGGRVMTVGGTGTFAINAAGTNAVVLSDFQHLPEISIEQAGTEIADGTGNFDFGTRTVGAGHAVVFTIRNSGLVPMSVGAVTIDGPQAGNFVLTTPPPTSVPPTGGVTFTVTFTASGSGQHDAAIHIVNGDANENPYDFALKGTGNYAPVLTIPASPVVAEATSPAGAVVNFAVSATDAEDDPDPTPAATPASGSTFPVGDTTVNVSVTDLGGATANDSFVVRVEDTTAPTVNGPFAPLTITIFTPLPDYTPQAVTSDAVGVVSVTQSPAPGGLLAAGPHTITITARDAADNEGQTTFNITVTDPAGSPVVTETVHAQGEQVPGEPAGTTFRTFGSPMVNDAGVVAFRTTIVSAGGVSASAIWDGGAVVARVGDSAPGLAGVTMAAFRDPAINTDGEIAFRTILRGAVTSSDNDVILANVGGPLAVIVRKGDALPGLGGAVIGSLDNMVLLDDALLFTARLKRGIAGVTALDDALLCRWSTGAGIEVLLRDGDDLGGRTVKLIAALGTARGSLGQGRSKGADATAVARVLLSDRRQAVIMADAGNVTIMAESTLPVPAAPAGALWSRFGLPMVNAAGGLACHATLARTTGGVTASDDTGIFADTVDGPLSLVLREGDSLGAATISQLLDPVYNASGDVLVQTRLAGAGAPQALVFVANGSVPEVVATTGDPAAETPGAVWASFTSAALPDGAGAVFHAKLTSGLGGVTTANNTGIWARDSGGLLRLLARTGNAVDVGASAKVIRSFSALTTTQGQTRSFNAARKVVYHAKFTDSTEAVMSVVIP